MSTFTQVILWIAFAFGFLGSPIMLVWGWARWQLGPKLRTISAVLSLIGFILATVSGVLAVSTIVFAQFHHFPYYDPLLLRIFRCGTYLSLGGIVFGGGVRCAGTLPLLRPGRLHIGFLQHRWNDLLSPSQAVEIRP
jgi:uncharacterized membrane protein YbhN (UPF0104 family)